MADERRNEGDRPDARTTSSTTISTSTTSAGGVDPATHTMETTPGMHTGREASTGMSGQTGSMSGQRGDMADRAQDKAGDVADRARQKANQLAGKARQQASTQISGQKERATEGLSGISSALHQTSQNLRGSNQDVIADYIDDAAGYVDEFTDYLRQRSVGDLLDEAQRLARREPALFIGGAFVLGLLGARFLKSSSPSSGYYGQDSYRSGYYGGSPYGGQEFRGQTYGSRGFEGSTRGAGSREESFGSYVPGGVAGDYTRTHAYEQHRSGTAAEEALGRRSSSNNPNEREEF
jgi:hypothetical protein